MPLKVKINTEKFVYDLYEMAKKFYTNADKVVKIIAGDGAVWIRESNYYLNNSYYILDKFHAIRMLKQTFSIRSKKTKQSKIFSNLKSYFEQGKVDEILDILNEIKEENKHENPKKLDQLITYFKNNKEGINNQPIKWNIGCSIEGDISRIAKWLLGYGTKAFSFKTYNNMLAAIVAQLIQLDSIELLKSEIQFNQEQKTNFYKYKHWLKEETSAKWDTFSFRSYWRYGKTISTRWNRD